MMKKNVGRTDQIIRFLLAIIIAGLGLYFQSWWGLLAIIPLVTGLARWCPLYSLLKISTNKEENVPPAGPSGTM